MILNCGVGGWIGPQPALLFPLGCCMAFSLSGGQLRHQAPRRWLSVMLQHAATVLKKPFSDGYFSKT